MSTKEDLLARGAFSTMRAHDNSGTYVLAEDGERLDFICNSEESPDGTWLYYSIDVRNWLGLDKHDGFEA